MSLGCLLVLKFLAFLKYMIAPCELSLEGQLPSLLIIVTILMAWDE